MKSISNLLQNYLNGSRSSLSFNGTTQSVSMPGIAHGIGNQSIEAWVNLLAPASPPNGGIIHRGGGVGRIWLIASHASLAQVELNSTWGVSDLYSAAANVTFGTWHHYVGTFDRAGSQIFYLDGLPVGSPFSMVSAGAIPWDSASSWAISGFVNSRANCIVREFRNYARVLTPTEVAEHYTGVYKNELGLVGWYPFADGTGTTLSDFSGYGNHGTLSNSPPWVASDVISDTRQIRVCDLLTITPVGAPAVYYTNCDVDISFGGHTYLSGDVKFTRSKITLATGLSVTNLDLELYGDASNLIGGLGVISACRAGVLDGARVKLDRLYMPAPVNVALGVINMFHGRVGPITASRSVAKLKVVSDTILLNVNMPRNVYQPGCRHTLFDTGCTLIKAAFAVNGTVASGSTTTSLNSNLTQADDYFTLGTMTMTSGVNNGLTRTVKLYKNASGVIAPILPWPVAPTAGDTFTAYPGCNKVQSTCSTKFNNLVHFRAEPYIPLPETQL